MGILIGIKWVKELSFTTSLFCTLHVISRKYFFLPSTHWSSKIYQKSFIVWANFVWSVDSNYTIKKQILCSIFKCVLKINNSFCVNNWEQSCQWPMSFRTSGFCMRHDTAKVSISSVNIIIVYQTLERF